MQGFLTATGLEQGGLEAMAGWTELSGSTSFKKSTIGASFLTGAGGRGKLCAASGHFQDISGGLRGRMCVSNVDSQR